MVSQVDIFASVAELIGAELPKNGAGDSHNVLPALLGETAQGREYIIQEAIGQIAVRKGNWKYLPSGNVSERGGVGEWIKTVVDDEGFLYNLAEDQDERKNLAEFYPNIIAEMEAIVKKIAPEKAGGIKNVDKKQLGF